MRPNPAISHAVLRDSSLTRSRPYLVDRIYRAVLIDESTPLWSNVSPFPLITDQPEYRGGEKIRGNSRWSTHGTSYRRDFGRVARNG